MLLAAVVASPISARAQNAGQGFLFGAPIGSFTIRGGWALAWARSDFFAFTTENLTLNRGDFSSPAIEADLAFRAGPRTQVVVSSGLSGMSQRSEFRHFIDNNDKPIEQTTTFRRIPISIGLKQYLTSTGRSIGRFAWIPSRVAPYIGGGVGINQWRYAEVGEFIDTDGFIFRDTTTYIATGTTVGPVILGGVRFPIGSRGSGLGGEIRWQGGNADLPNIGFFGTKLDLGGFNYLFTVNIGF